MKPVIYLAGPEVFLPAPLRIAEAKKYILARLDLDGLFPLDNVIPPETENIADLIALANYAMIDRCNAIIANLTPFRGPSADVGTACEVAYAYAKGKPVFAYTNDPRPYKERVLEDGMKIEDFALFDNLMLPCAIEKSGGSLHRVAAADIADLRAFEQAARDAAFHLHPAPKI